MATTAVQPVQPVGETGVKQPSLARLKQAEAALLQQPAGRRVPRSLSSRTKTSRPFAWARSRKTKRPAWPKASTRRSSGLSRQAVQVVIDKTQAVVETGDQRAQATFRVDLPDNPRLRVIKVASTNQAKPGDLVDFTIRFDNVGDARDRQRDADRQLDHAAGICRRLGQVEPRRPIHHVAQSRRIAGAALGICRSARTGPRRAGAISVPRPLSTTVIPAYKHARASAGDGELPCRKNVLLSAPHALCGSPSPRRSICL